MLPCFIRKLDELLKPPDMVAFFVNQLFLKLLTKKNVDEAKKLNINSVVEYLKEGQKSLPKHMYDCCGIAVGSVRDAINLTSPLQYNFLLFFPTGI